MGFIEFTWFTTKSVGICIGYCNVCNGIAYPIRFFGGRYKKIMQAFVEYNYSSHDLMPTLICGIVWMAIVSSSTYAIISDMHGRPSMLLIATILNLSIFITAEVVFRFWWKSWLRHSNVC